MRKNGIILAAAVILLLCFSAPARADNYDPHGDFSANTEACASCHSTHSATAPDLLNLTDDNPANSQNYIYRTCMFCHDGTGSKYDEVDGQILESDGSRYPTAGGGFENMATIGGAPGVWATAPVTSSHLAGQPDDVHVNIPGGNQTAGGQISLTCDSCHDPHGAANSSGNSRLLWNNISVFGQNNNVTTVSTIVNNNLVTTGQTVSTGITINYVTTTTGETETYNTAISNFCGACHQDYLQTNGSTSTGDFSSAFRHPVAVNGADMTVDSSNGAKYGYDSNKFSLPTATSADGSKNNMTCLTCHYAHGTTSVVSTSTYDPPAPVRPSTLLRMDERGVCQNCHNEFPDTNSPTVLAATTNPTIANRDSSYITPDKQHVVLTFSTYMNSHPANGYSVNYNQSVSSNTPFTITGQSGLTVTSASLQPNGTIGKQVLLTLSGTITSPITITVNSNVEDLNGNHIPAASGNTVTLDPTNNIGS